MILGESFLNGIVAMIDRGGNARYWNPAVSKRAHEWFYRVSRYHRQSDSLSWVSQQDAYFAHFIFL